MITSKAIAAIIMAHLRNRNEFHKILGRTPTTDGTPWVALKTQDIMEEDIADIVDVALQEAVAKFDLLKEENDFLRFFSDTDKVSAAEKALHEHRASKKNAVVRES